jgi:predicted GNAT superfamily acetyltransferase
MHDVQSKTRPNVGSKVVIRPATDLDEFARCVELQVEVWGYDAADVMPKRMFLIAQRIGGQVLCAFDTALPGGARNLANMVGFAMALPGYRSGHAYLHSHMLAVTEAYRNSGIGRALKLAQRDDALARGIELIEWTFDPLEIKNSHLNIERLGAISRRYAADIYGSTSSEMQGGLPSDRLFAEWWLRSKRVQGIVLYGEVARLRVQQTVTVPHEIRAWKAKDEDREKALAVQTANREELQRAFRNKLSVIGFTRDEQGNGSFELGRWDEDFDY